MNRMLSTLITVVCLVLIAANPARADLTASLDSKISGPLVADFPIIFQLTINITGSEPLFFRHNGGPIPEAGRFLATFRDARGNAKVVNLNNGDTRAPCRIT